MNEVPHFDEAQKKYFQEQLAAQSGKTLNLASELLTHEQRADLAHESGDLSAVLSDPRTRQAYTQKFGVAEFGRQHLAHTRTQREKARQAEQERLIAQNKARRHRIG